MLSNSIELVDRHLAQNVSIDITQQMVRIDSTNGKEADLGNRLAAQLELIGVGRVWVEDLRSTNGTLLNGQRLRRPAPLRPGDRLTIGDAVLALRSEPVLGAAVP